jgi:hypothetical protein
MAKFNFNSATVEPMAARSFDPLPKGDYEMMIVKSDVKSTQAGTGHYIELEMHVIGGEHSGRRIWERLNVDNPNKTAQDISQGLLASLCFAVGVAEIGETEELHDTPFIAHVEIDKKDPTRNRIMGYATAGMAPAMATKAPAPAPTPAPAAATKRPWG